MDAILRHASQRVPAVIDWIGGLVRVESPSHDKAAVDRATEYVADRVAKLARIRVHKQRDYGNHLRLEFTLPSRKKSGQILGLGHLDTVWPLGTLEQMPFQQSRGRLWGPGVFDMKAGVAFFVFAAEMLRELDVPVSKKVVLQLNSDEEIGSPSSRSYTEAEARRSAAVLVAEPAAGLQGDLKTARKGGGTFTIRVHGKSAHAGLDFTSGASAIVELARQIGTITQWTDLNHGITVNPGVIQGGTRSNVVAEEAWAQVDVRVWRASQARRLEKKFSGLKPFDRRTRVTVEGKLARLPFERTPDVVKLFRLAQKLAGDMGVRVGEAAVGGGSDGNLTAALGVPTLDGLGAVGEGAHARNESIAVGRIADRIALLAGLIAAL